MLSDSITIAATVGQAISLNKAIEWTGTYQEAHPGKLRSVYFSKEVFKTLLDQSASDGIRIYLANDGTHDTLILVGATEDTDQTEDGSNIFDHGHVSPPRSVVSPLNQ